MTLIEKINNDLKTAMKARDEVRMNCLRQVKTAVMNKEVAKKKTLDDAEVTDVISSLAKSHVESIESFKKGNREDLIAKEEQEMAILKTYLPEQLPDEELKKIVADAVTASGASGMKDMGKVMALIMPQVKGRADGSKINAMVKELLPKG